MPHLSFTGAALGGALLAVPALWLLRKSGKVEGETYVLKSDAGIEVHISQYGALILKLVVPDKSGKPADIVLGYDSLQEYARNHSYYGSVVGRVANRIAEGEFMVDGTEHHLTINDPPNALHGGNKGFDKHLYEGQQSGNSVRLTRTSGDGEEGYPGNVKVSLTYELVGTTLTFTVDADTDKPTPINVTQHSYFNLAGQGNGTVQDHVLTIPAEHYTPKDKTSIPRGEIAPVVGTAFDFRQPRAIGARSASVPGGYDHNWCLSDYEGRTAASMGRQSSRLAAELHHPESGRTMKVSTNAPGLQFYGGNFLDGTGGGKNGAEYVYQGAVCLEPQSFPNSVNEPGFPSVILRPGEHYHHAIKYEFSW